MKIKFDELPLGARFKYKPTGETWVKLDPAGEGRVVRYVPIRSGRPQTVCAAADDDRAREQLIVHPMDDDDTMQVSP